MPLKRLLLLVAVGTLLSACSISDQEEESTAQTKSSTPNSTTSSEVPTTTSRSYDLNTKSGFIYHIKEHGTIPDYYLNVFASGASEAEEGPTSYEVNATTLKKAGAVACNNDQILDDAKYLLTHGEGALAELAAKPEEFDQKYAPVYEALDISADAPPEDRLFSLYMASVGSLATCGDKYTDKELEAVADAIFSL
ncbi:MULTISPECIES: hypothetical protein [Corynebacterium]|jgi:hypothetical protein|uniref:Uncharacterized protein n=1 Tax=Corynebacterium kefirresidentii TaxID=1979527 RepID=A0ABT8Q4Z2_9CORY|nr:MULTISPECIES: hypothetical protein [Corynebacterium]MDN8620435.1 hypothetical protein [Corynebacterium kefirresidentii]MDN8642539.1 hypothetical protein [Corynebacterium kefirresidentii]MDU4569253.1 hypothetical protein [Corynebacterium sp.]MDU6014033.1 hypothetical protein [Corynebacterium sp.]